MALLEEYIQEEYLEFYEDSDKYPNNLELLCSKIPNLFFKNGVKNYIVYDGKMYYLINKSNLPEEIKESLVGGDSKDEIALKSLYDVYGVNLDLTVYYIDNRNEITYGNVTPNEIDKNAVAGVLASGDSELKKAVEDKLKSLGVTIDPEIGITVGNLSSIKDLTIDGKVNNVKDLSGIADLTGLKTLTLIDLNLNNLKGLDNCILIESLYLDNCIVNELDSGFTPLCSLTKLNTFYIKLPPSVDVTTANNQVVGLSNGLKDADYIDNLETFGIFGNDELLGSIFMLDERR